MGGKVLVPTSEFISQVDCRPAGRRCAAACPRCWSPEPTPTARTCSPATSTSTISRSSPANAPLTDSSRHRGGIDCAIARGWRTRRMPTCCGARPRSPTWTRRGGSPRLSTHVPRQAARLQLFAVVQLEDELDEATIARFQRELGAMGYKFQFVTLAGFHALNLSMFELAAATATPGWRPTPRLQEEEFALEREHGYRAMKHQRFVRHGLFRSVDDGHDRRTYIGRCAGWINRAGTV